MGSFNVTCQVSGYTIGHEDSCVGFFVEPQSPRDDDSHRPDRPLNSMFGQWRPVHLPVHGRYDDYGRMNASSKASPIALKNASDRLDGFGFTDEEWERTDIGSIHSRYCFWQVREDVFNAVAQIGKQHPEGLLAENKEVLISLFNDYASDENCYSQALNFFAGLNVLGYGFREFVQVPDQCAYNDHLRLLPIRKAILLAQRKDLGKVPELPGRSALFCGISRKPIQNGEHLVILPLSSVKADDYKGSGRFTRSSNFDINSHYELIGGPIDAWMDESGHLDISASENKEALLEGLNALIEGYTEENPDKRSFIKERHFSAMVISKDVFDIVCPLAMAYKGGLFSDNKPIHELLKADFDHAKKVMTQFRTVISSEDMDAIRQLFDEYNLGQFLSEDRLVGDPEERKSKIRRLPWYASQALKRIQMPNSEGFLRNNTFSRLLDTSSSPFDVESMIKHDSVIEDYLDGSGDEKSLDRIMASMMEATIITRTLGHVGIGFCPTEPRALGVCPDVSLDAWTYLEQTVHRLVNRDFEAMKNEMDY